MKARLMENENSPAMVDVKLPPMMLPVPPLAIGWRLKMNTVDPRASIVGPGNGRSARRPAT